MTKKGITGGVHILDDWDVLAVKGKGIYVRGDGDPWRIVSRDELMMRHGELANAYKEATGDWGEDE